MAKRPVPAPVRTVDMAPLSVRAELQTANDEARTVELIWTTGAPVERYDWMGDKRYLETLSLDPAHVRLDRLNQGGPLLDSHSAYSVGDILGTVVPGSVELRKKDARATVRFSKRDTVEPIWQDVRDGVIRSVSVGYRIYAFEESTPKGDKLPIRKAIDWEPFEISMVPIPADFGAMARGARPADSNQCRIVAVRDGKESQMERDDQPEFIAEDNPLGGPAPAPTRAAPPVPTEPNEGDRGATRERERVQGILLACRAARLPQEFADRLIADPAMSLVRAQTLVFEELSKRDRSGEGPQVGVPGRIEVGDDPLVHRLEGVREAILHRAAPDLRKPDGTQAFPLTDAGRQFRGLSMLDIGRAILNARGVRTSHMSKMELAGAALGLDTRGGMHTTSDFALLLADVGGKVLRAAYEAAPQTWMPLARRVSISDFKPVRSLSMGGAPALLEVLEHGEFTRGTIAEGKEEFQLKTYGRVFAITRQALVNDDTDAFSRVAMMFGRAARNLESDIVWALITANAAMADGVAIFHATHANLVGPTVISIDSLGVARAAMLQQTDLDGVTYLNVAARHLVVPAALQTIAQQYVAATLVPAEAGKVNPFAGQMDVIAEPRLDANSATAWYLASSPDQVDMILYGTLQDQDGPVVESRTGFDVDGVEIKARHDFAAKVVEYRGMVKNA